MFIEHGLTGNHESGSAEAALRGIVIDEGLLERMQLVTFHQRLDGRDLLSLRLDGKHGAGVDSLVVEHDGAGAALGRVRRFSP
jgi:hypothetical protein